MKTMLFLALLTSTISVFAHGGRTNSSGCHNDHKTGGYHCHRSDNEAIKSAIRNPASVKQTVKTKKVSKTK